MGHWQTAAAVAAASVGAAETAVADARETAVADARVADGAARASSRGVLSAE